MYYLCTLLFIIIQWKDTHKYSSLYSCDSVSFLLSIFLCMLVIILSSKIYFLCFFLASLLIALIYYLYSFTYYKCLQFHRGLQSLALCHNFCCINGCQIWRTSVTINHSLCWMLLIWKLTWAINVLNHCSKSQMFSLGNCLISFNSVMYWASDFHFLNSSNIPVLILSNVFVVPP